ncbi:MAG: hypothetical protein FJ027_07060 [Candidatus Rokubacteria bacterium]|nr:hypothetical protein [Candidatus Rokubacteria bacterium]
MREHTEKIKPPRALFVPFPFGHAFGRPNDAALQARVLRAALELLTEPAGPVLRDFPDDAEPGDQPPAPTQASAVTVGASVPGDPNAEVRAMQARHARWLGTSGGRTAFGLSGLPLERVGDLAAFLQRFADGVQGLKGPRDDVPLPAFVRWGADDIKALYFEGYLAAKPEAGGDEIARWFWGETAMGQALRRVKDRLDASDDPKWKAAAFGVAR